jgi:hypothetical protein
MANSDVAAFLGRLPHRFEVHCNQDGQHDYGYTGRGSDHIRSYWGYHSEAGKKQEAATLKQTFLQIECRKETTL